MRRGNARPETETISVLGPQQSPSLASPGGFFNNNANLNYLLSLSNPTSAAYNAIAYGNTSWPSTQQTQVPLSSYSSLNGATTSTSAPQIQQQSSSAQQQQVVIE